MKWGAQVGHVFAKDVRYARWAIGLFVGFTVLSMLRVFVSPENSLIGSALPSVILAILGIVTAASIVQGDSPTTAKAFWASRPVSPTAVLMAKLVFLAVVLIGVPVVGELVGLRAYEVDMRSMAAFSAGSAATYGSLVTLAVVVAAGTSDLRSFGLVYIAVFILSFVIGMMASPTPQVQSAGPGVNGMLFVSAAVYLGFLYHVYRRREASRRVWLVIPALLVANAVVGDRLAFGRAHFKESVAAPRLEFAAFDDPHRGVAEQFRLVVKAVGAPKDVQFALALDGMTAHLVNGEIIHLKGFQQGALLSSATLPTRTGPVTVHDAERDDTPHVVSVTLNNDQTKKILAGVSRVDVDAHLIAARPRLVDEFSTLDARTIQARGARMVLHDAVIGGDTASVQFDTRYFNDGSSDYSYGYGGRLDAPTIALVSDSLHWAMPMRNFNGGGGSSGWFVLPGVTLSHESGRLGFQPGFVGRVLIGSPPGLLRNARFAVYDWDRLGAVAIHQTVVLRGP